MKSLHKITAVLCNLSLLATGIQFPWHLIQVSLGTAPVAEAQGILQCQANCPANGQRNCACSGGNCSDTVDGTLIEMGPGETQYSTCTPDPVEAPDNCPADPAKTEPGICGCGTADIDSDGDGLYDCGSNPDACPADFSTNPDGCPIADPFITKSVTSGNIGTDVYVDGGGIVVFDVQYGNNGDADMTNVAIAPTLTLPACVTDVDCGTNETATIGALAAGATGSLTCSMNASACTDETGLSLTNLVTLTGDGPAGPVDPVNSSVTLQINDKPAGDPTIADDIAVTKTGGDFYQLLGENYITGATVDGVSYSTTINYSVSVTNSGAYDIAAPGLPLTDTVGESAPGCADITNVPTETGPIAAGDTVNITYAVDYSACPTTETANLGNNVDIAGNTSEVTYGIGIPPVPNVEIAKGPYTEEYETDGSFTITATNTGSARMDNFVIQDSLPNGMVLTGAPYVTTGTASNATIVGSAGDSVFSITIAQLDSQQFPPTAGSTGNSFMEFTVPVRAEGTPSTCDPVTTTNTIDGASQLISEDIGNTGTVDQGATGEYATTASAAVGYLPVKAELGTSYTGAQLAAGGQSYDYQLVVTNPGNIPLEDSYAEFQVDPLYIKNPTDPGGIFVFPTPSASGAPADLSTYYTDGIIKFNIGTVNAITGLREVFPGESITINLELSIPAAAIPGSGFGVRSYASGYDPCGPYVFEQTIQTVIEGNPVGSYIQVTKQHDKAQIPPEGFVNYYITANNIGLSNDTNTWVMDYVPQACKIDTTGNFPGQFSSGGQLCDPGEHIDTAFVEAYTMGNNPDGSFSEYTQAADPTSQLEDPYSCVDCVVQFACWDEYNSGLPQFAPLQPEGLDAFNPMNFDTTTFEIDMAPVEAAFTPGVETSPGVWVPAQCTPDNVMYVAWKIPVTISPDAAVNPDFDALPPEWNQTMGFRVQNQVVGHRDPALITPNNGDEDYTLNEGFGPNGTGSAAGTIFCNRVGIMSNDLIQAYGLPVCTTIVPDPDFEIDKSSSPENQTPAGSEFDWNIDFVNITGAESTIARLIDNLDLTKFSVESVSFTWNQAAADGGAVNGLVETEVYNAATGASNNVFFEGQDSLPTEFATYEALAGTLMVFDVAAYAGGTLEGLWGGQLKVTVTANADIPSGEFIENSGYICYDKPNEGVTNLCLQVSDNIQILNPDLLILKSSDATIPVGSTLPKVEAGGNANYSLTFANEGEAGAPEFTIVDTLPEGLCYSAANTVQSGSVFPTSVQNWNFNTFTVTGTCGAGTNQVLTWADLEIPSSFNTAIGTLPITLGLEQPRVEFLLEVAGDAPQGTNLENCAVVDATGLETQLNGSADPSCDSEGGNLCNTDCHTIVVPGPDLEVLKESDGISIDSGGTGSYTIQYKNNSEVNALNSVIVDVIPTNATVQSAFAPDATVYYIDDAALDPATLTAADVIATWSTSVVTNATHVAFIQNAQTITTPDGDVIYNDGDIPGYSKPGGAQGAYYSASVTIRATDNLGVDAPAGTEFINCAMSVSPNGDEDLTNNEFDAAAGVDAEPRCALKKVPDHDAQVTKNANFEGILPGVPPGTEMIYELVYESAGSKPICGVRMLESPDALLDNFQFDAGQFITADDGFGNPAVFRITEGAVAVAPTSAADPAWVQPGVVPVTVVGNEVFLGSNDPASADYYMTLCFESGAIGAITARGDVSMTAENGAIVNNGVVIVEDHVPDGPEGNPDNNDDDTEVYVWWAELTLEKTGADLDRTDVFPAGDPEETRPEHVIEYTIGDIQNTGDGVAEAPILSDSIPFGTCLEVTSGLAGGWSDLVEPISDDATLVFYDAGNVVITPADSNDGVADDMDCTVARWEIQNADVGGKNWKLENQQVKFAETREVEFDLNLQGDALNTVAETETQSSSDMTGAYGAGSSATQNVSMDASSELAIQCNGEVQIGGPLYTRSGWSSEACVLDQIGISPPYDLFDTSNNRHCVDSGSFGSPSACPSGQTCWTTNSGGTCFSSSTFNRIVECFECTAGKGWGYEEVVQNSRTLGAGQTEWTNLEVTTAPAGVTTVHTAYEGFGCSGTVVGSITGIGTLPVSSTSAWVTVCGTYTVDDPSTQPPSTNPLVILTTSAAAATSVTGQQNFIGNINDPLYSWDTLTITEPADITEADSVLYEVFDNNTCTAPAALSFTGAVTDEDISVLTADEICIEYTIDDATAPYPTGTVDFTVNHTEGSVTAADPSTVVSADLSADPVYGSVTNLDWLNAYTLPLVNIGNTEYNFYAPNGTSCNLAAPLDGSGIVNYAPEVNTNDSEIPTTGIAPGTTDVCIYGYTDLGYSIPATARHIVQFAPQSQELHLDVSGVDVNAWDKVISAGSLPSGATLQYEFFSDVACTTPINDTNGNSAVAVTSLGQDLNIPFVPSTVDHLCVKSTITPSATNIPVDAEYEIQFAVLYSLQPTEVKYRVKVKDTEALAAEAAALGQFPNEIINIAQIYTPTPEGPRTNCPDITEADIPLGDGCLVNNDDHRHIIPDGDLEIDKAIDPLAWQSTDPSNLITYTLEVVNNGGNQGATNPATGNFVQAGYIPDVYVVETIPAGLTYTGFTSVEGNFTLTSSTINADGTTSLRFDYARPDANADLVDYMPPNERQTIIITTTVDETGTYAVAPGDILTNNACTYSETYPDLDVEEDQVTHTEGPDFCDTKDLVIGGAANPYVYKSADQIVVLTGNTFEYTLEFGNNGNIDATNFTLSDPLPLQVTNGTIITDNSPAGVNCTITGQDVECTGTLAPNNTFPTNGAGVFENHSLVIEVEMESNADVLNRVAGCTITNNLRIENTATVSADDNFDTTDDVDDAFNCPRIRYASLDGNVFVDTSILDGDTTVVKDAGETGLGQTITGKAAVEVYLFGLDDGGRCYGPHPADPVYQYAIDEGYFAAAGCADADPAANPNYVSFFNYNVGSLSDRDIIDGTDFIGRPKTTNEDGKYEFTNLFPGTYSVLEIQPDGYASTGSNPGEIATVETGTGTTNGGADSDFITGIVLGSSQHSANNDFGEIAGRIGDFIFFEPEDGNENGEYEIANDEIPLPYVTVQLTRADQPGSVSTESGQDGFYIFENLPVSSDTFFAADGSVNGVATTGIDYTVTVTDTRGVTTSITSSEVLAGNLTTGTTTDANNDMAHTTGGVTVTLQPLVAEVQSLDNDFGYHGPFGSIGDTVFYEETGASVDSVYEEGIDTPVPFARVCLVWDANGDGVRDVLDGDVQWECQYTDANGYYLFETLPLFSYFVTVDDQFSPGISPNWTTVHTAATAAGTIDNEAKDPVEHYVVLADVDGERDYIAADFGFTGPAGTIGNVIFVDRNLNGEYEPTTENEIGIQGVAVTLYWDPNGDGVLDATDLDLDNNGVIDSIFIDTSSIIDGTVTDPIGTPDGVIDIHDLVYQNVMTNELAAWTELGFYEFTGLPLDGPNALAKDYVVVVTDETGVLNRPGVFSTYDPDGDDLSATGDALDGDAATPGGDSVDPTTYENMFASGLVTTTDNIGKDAAGYAVTLSSAANPLGSVTDEVTADFGYFTPGGEIGDRVWYDQNDDGVYDPATELGLNDVTLRLYFSIDAGTTWVTDTSPSFVVASNGEIFPSTAAGASAWTQETIDDDTGAPGFYLFSGLPFELADGTAIQYAVEVDVTDTDIPAGSETTYLGHGNAFTNASTETVNDNDAKLPGDATDTAVMGGYTFFIADNGTNTTDYTGDFGFVLEGSVGGDDDDTETDPTDGDDETEYCDAAGGRGLLFYDYNNNGLKDADEAAMADVDVIMEQDLGAGLGYTTYGTISSNTNGFYEFTNLPLLWNAGGTLTPVNYRVSVDLADADFPAGYASTHLQTPAGNTSDDSYAKNPAGYIIASIDTAADPVDRCGERADFGFNLLGRVGNFVWYDQDDNGAFDAIEIGIAGVTVNLEYNDAGAWVSASTLVVDGSGATLGAGATAVTSSTVGEIGKYEFGTNGGLPLYAVDGTVIEYRAVVDTATTPAGYVTTHESQTTGGSYTVNGGYGAAGNADNFGRNPEGYEFFLSDANPYEAMATPDDFEASNRDITGDFGFILEGTIGGDPQDPTNPADPEEEGDYCSGGGFIGQVFVDVDNDGFHDVATEPGLAGITAALFADYGDGAGYVAYDAGAGAVTDTSDANGEYVFTDLPLLWNNGTDGTLTPVQYEVRVDIDPANGFPAGYESTHAEVAAADATSDSFAKDPAGYIIPATDTLHTDTDRCGESPDFGFVPLGAIGSHVWYDENNDGVRDAATELPMVGVEVDLLVSIDGGTTFFPITDTANVPDIFGGVITNDTTNDDTDVTDADGYYQFTKLPLKFVATDGSLGNLVYQVQLDETQTAIPTGYVTTEDEHGNATTTAGADDEAKATSGYTIPLDVADADPSNGVENNDQTADFGFVLLGTIGGTPTDPIYPPTDDPEDDHDDYCTGQNLDGTVWTDANNNGVLDAGEPGIGGLTVTLNGDPDGDGTLQEVATAVTDANGQYVFAELPVLRNDNGTLVNIAYEVVLDVSQAAFPAGYESTHIEVPGTTTDGEAKDPAGYTVPNPTSGLYAGGDQCGETPDFGFIPLGTAGSTVWYDYDNDGVYDSGDENGVVGIAVTLEVTDPVSGLWVSPSSIGLITETNDGTNNDTTATDATGEYEFSKLPLVGIDGAGALTDLQYRVVPTVGAGTPLENWDTTHERHGNDFDASTEADINDGDAKNPAVYEFFFDYQNAVVEDLTGDFGFTQLGSVGNFMYFDFNADGDYDPADPNFAEVPLPGVGIELWVSTNGGSGFVRADAAPANIMGTNVLPSDVSLATFAQTTTSGAPGVEGSYSFENLPLAYWDGTSVVELIYQAKVDPTTVPVGYASSGTATTATYRDDSVTEAKSFGDVAATGAADGYTFALELNVDAAFNEDISGDFGIYAHGTIGDFVFYDFDFSGDYALPSTIAGLPDDSFLGDVDPFNIAATGHQVELQLWADLDHDASTGEDGYETLIGTQLSDPTGTPNAAAPAGTEYLGSGANGGTYEFLELPIEHWHNGALANVPYKVNVKTDLTSPDPFADNVPPLGFISTHILNDETDESNNLSKDEEAYFVELELVDVAATATHHDRYNDTADFGYALGGEIGTQVFFDWNADGVFDRNDPNEYGIDGVQVHLYWDPTCTGTADTEWQLSPLTTGDDLQTPGVVEEGYYNFIGLPVAICDYDGDGSYEADWRVEVPLQPLTAQYDPTRGESSESYPVVNIVGPDDHSQDENSHLVRLQIDNQATPENEMHHHFADYGYTTSFAGLSGYVFHDRNEDVLFDEDGAPGTQDDPIEGTEMILWGYDDYGNVWGPNPALGANHQIIHDWIQTNIVPGIGGPYEFTDQMFTDATGYYAFPDLRPGVYNVIQLQPEGFYSTGSTAGTNLPVNQNGEGSVEGAIGGTRPLVGTPLEIFLETVNYIENIELESADNSVQNNFGENLGSVGNFVFKDVNEDGTYNPGPEFGLEGVGITLCDGSGVVIPGATEVFTDAGGFYLIDELMVNVYTDHDADAATPDYLTGLTPYVCVTTPPASYTSTNGGPGGEAGNDSANDPAGAPVAVSTEEPDSGEGDFGYAPSEFGSIGNVVFYDTDDSGTFTAGDTPIVVEVHLYDAVGNPVTDVAGNPVVAQTDPTTGEYYFTDLPFGTYEVRVVDAYSLITTFDSVHDAATPNSSTPAAPGVDNLAKDPTGYFFTIDLTNRHDYTGDFGYIVSDIPPVIGDAEVGNVVWLDTNGDGIRDAGEPGIAGVTVDLYDDTGAYVGTETTNTAGEYYFTFLEYGTYSVVVTDTLNILGPLGLTTTGADAVADEHGVDPETAHDENGTAVTVTEADPINYSADFGYNVATADKCEIGNYIWRDDATKNGLYDAGETGIANVVVELQNGSGAVVATTMTDVNGEYYFENIDCGTYTVVATPPTNMVSTDTETTSTGNDVANDPVGYTITVDTTTPVDHSADFAFVAGPDVPFPVLGEVGNYVWYDNNNDGLRDTGESGIEGVTLELYLGTTLIATETTDNTGEYYFTGIPVGTYTVVVTDATNQLAGLTSTDGQTLQVGNNRANTPSGYEVTITAAQPTDYSADFAYVDPTSDPLCSIGNYVWYDANENGNWDAASGTESPMQGVMVELYDAAGNFVTMTATDATGQYFFTQLECAVYEVRIPATDPVYTNFTSTDGTGTEAKDPVGHVVDLTVTPNYMDADFGWVAQPSVILGEVGNQIWEDVDGDGTFTLGTDSALAGIEVELYDGAVLIGTTYTDGAGQYEFVNLLTDDGSGSHSYSVVVPSQPALSTYAHIGGPSAGVDNNSQTPTGYTVTIDPVNTTDYTADFGYELMTEAPLGSIGDYVWVDTNADGIQDPSEIGIQGVVVELYDATGTLITTATTGPNGEYLFSGLPITAYTVSIPSGQTPLVPYTNVNVNTAQDPSGYGVILTASVPDVLTADFGYTPDPAVITGEIGNQLWEDTDGDGVFTGVDLVLPGVTVELFNGAGTLIGTAVTDAAGEYYFTNLPVDDGSGSATYTVVIDEDQSALNGMSHVAGPSVGTNDNSQEPSGYDVTIDATTTTDYTADFGFEAVNTAPICSIGNRMWYDAGDTPNGLYDIADGDTPLANMELTITNTGTGEVIVTTTDLDGLYTVFVECGTYEVVVTDNNGYTWVPGTNPTTDDNSENPLGVTVTVDPINNPNEVSVDFGYHIPSTPPVLGEIGNLVWYDDNGNGQVDAGEAPIAGVTIEAVDAYGNVHTAITDINGEYYISGIPVGDYTVTVTDTNGVLANVTSTDGAATGTGDNFAHDPAGTVVTITEAAPINHTADFGYEDPAGTPLCSIGDFVWKDFNGNGIQDDGASANFAGVTVDLYDAAGVYVMSAVTDTNGGYSFPLLECTAYEVRIDTTQPATATWLVSSGPEAQDPVSYPVVLDGTTPETTDHTLADFAFLIDENNEGVVGFIGDQVWIDENSDGIFNAGDTPLAGITVELYDTNGNLLQTEVTDANGTYLFDELTVDDGTGSFDYVVVIPSQMALAPYTHVLGTNGVANNHSKPEEHPVTLDPTVQPSYMAADFGYEVFNEDAPVGSIGDYVWFETDADGVQNDGGPIAGINGVVIELCDENGVLIATTTTDSTGFYQFTNLPLGDYTVKVSTTNPPLIGLVVSVGPDAQDPTGVPVTLTPSVPDVDYVDFGYNDSDPYTGNVGTLSGHVWVDNDCDGDFDGEQDLSGVYIEIYKDMTGDGQTADDIVVATATTASPYLIENLPVDDQQYYAVVVSGIPGGYVEVLGNLTNPHADEEGKAHDGYFFPMLTPLYTMDASGDFAAASSAACSNTDGGGPETYDPTTTTTTDDGGDDDDETEETDDMTEETDGEEPPIRPEVQPPVPYSPIPQPPIGQPVDRETDDIARTTSYPRTGMSEEVLALYNAVSQYTDLEVGDEGYVPMAILSTQGVLPTDEAGRVFPGEEVDAVFLAKTLLATAKDDVDVNLYNSFVMVPEFVRLDEQQGLNMGFERSIATVNGTVTFEELMAAVAEAFGWAPRGYLASGPAAGFEANYASMTERKLVPASLVNAAPNVKVTRAQAAELVFRATLVTDMGLIVYPEQMSISVPSKGVEAVETLPTYLSRPDLWVSTLQDNRAGVYFNPSDKYDVEMVVFGHSSQFAINKEHGAPFEALVGGVERGEEIIMEVNGEEKVYRVVDSRMVDESDMDALTKAENVDLVVFTCDFPDITKRHMIYAVEVEQTVFQNLMGNIFGN